jgi:uncharacterized protein YcbK (DUF882 family)
MSNWTRRRWLQTVVAGSVAMPLARFASARDSAGEASAVAPAPERFIQLLNTHTNETVGVVYKRGREYDPAAIAKLQNLLRDHRNGEVHEMDPGLYDQLHELALAADCDPHFEVISGYRSPESNDKMSSRPGSGVAKKSLHMEGRAVDVRLCHCACTNLRDLALAAKRGGVGYYQRSDFVHIDTGTFRTWVG